MNESELRDVTLNCDIWIDKDGRWFYEDKEIVNPGVVKAFQNSLHLKDGRHRIIIESEVCYVKVKDAPFIVKSFNGEPDTGLTLVLNNSDMVPFDPDKSWFGKDNVLYIKLPSGLHARFSRNAYYKLALLMEEDKNGNIFLELKGKRYSMFQPV